MVKITLSHLLKKPLMENFILRAMKRVNEIVKLIKHKYIEQVSINGS